MKSNGKHLRQRVKMPSKRGKGSRALVKPEGSTYARARSTRCGKYGRKQGLNRKLYKSAVAIGLGISYEKPNLLRDICCEEKP